jgi:hypothetical protein
MTDNNTNPTYNIQIVYYIDWIEYKENWNNQSEIYKNTTDRDRYASYLELHLEIDSDERLRTYLLYFEKNIESNTIRLIDVSTFC